MYIKKNASYPELEQKVIELYNSGKSQKEICKELDLQILVVRRWLRELLPNRRKYTGKPKKKRFNEFYFSEIDTSDKAYFLGLLYADGNVYEKRYRMQIFLQKQDKPVLEMFKKYLKSNIKLYNDTNKGYKLILDSKVLYNDLLKCGVTPNKCFTITFPNEDVLPKQLYNHFIRGFFDGDGGITMNNNKRLSISFTSNEQFLKQLGDILKVMNIYFSPFRKRYKFKEISSGSIIIARRSSYKTLYEYLYKDSDELYMKRKREKFEVGCTSKYLRPSRYDK